MRRTSFRNTEHTSVDELADYLRSVFFDNPWSGDRVPSLVYENGNGDLVGFLGVIARPMLFDGRPITSAVLSTFMVHHEHRGKGIGRDLMQHYFDGPQEFSWSDVANTATRAVWRSLGGRTTWLYNLYWTRPIRPLRSASAAWKDGRVGRLARLAVRPIAAAMDPLAVRLPGMPQQIARPKGSIEPLSSEAIEQAADELLSDYSVRPVYSASAMTWLGAQLADRPFGRFQRVLVRREDGTVAGWFMYFVNPRGTGEVVQIVVGKNDAGLVLDHLIQHAWNAGVVTLAGRLDPRLLTDMSSRGFRFARADPWVLLHSRNPALTDAIQNGDAFLSRLEGEWWMGA